MMVKGAPDELVLGQLRDWNEELQVARELPIDNTQLKIYRDKLIFKVSYLHLVVVRKFNYTTC